MDILQNLYSMLNFEISTLNIEFLLKLFTALICFACLVKFLSLKHGKKRNYPPGPSGLPLVGYLPFLTKTPHLKFKELAEKYGNVFSLYLGRQFVVVLSDVNSLRDTFNRDEFHGRPPGNLLCPGAFTKSLSTVNGKDWMESRKLIFHTVKGMGRGNEFIENLAKEEIHRFFDYVEEQKDKAFDIKSILSTCVSNIMTGMAFGKQYDHGDETRDRLNNIIQSMIEHGDMTSTQEYLKWLQWMPIINKYQGWDVYLKELKVLRDFFEKEVADHKRTLDLNEPRDFIDACLIQMKKAAEQGQQALHDEETLLGNLFALLVAGGETVRTSLHWLFHVLIAYPDVQKKLRKEVDEIVGKEREPMWSDQKNMPYTLSVIMEIQRLFTIVPLNVFHYTLKDAKAGEYDIPKGTLVLNNLYTVLHDPKHWKEPEKFIPGRFLDANEKKIVKPDSYLPFSFGKRICPGENLAMIEMFLFLATTVQKYEVYVPAGQNVSLEATYLITTQPKDQDICFRPRPRN